MRLRATIESTGKTAAGIEIPDDVVAALGAGNRPAVTVTIGAHRYRSTVSRMGGRFLLPVSNENRALAGVAAGDEVEVTLELDTEPRQVEIPADLAAAFLGTPQAKRAFDSLSYSNQRRYVLAIEGAKAAETRQRRIAKTIAELAGG